MDTVIDRLELRHRLPPSESDAKARLDAIGRRVVEDGVPLALEHAGVLADEEVCIHHLTVSLRVDLSRGERAVARQWQSCLVTEILRIVQDDDPDEIVRYPNRVRALLDFAKSIVHGDLTRAWAWRQLGLVQARELDLGRARRELVTGLCAHPEAIGAVVGALAERVHDDALHIALSPDAWDSLARAVLRRFGHGPGVLQAARSTDARPSIEHRDRTEPVGTAVGTASDELVASAEREPTWLELPWRTTPALRRIAARLPGDRRHAVAVVALAAHEPAAIYGRPRSNLVQQLCAMTRRVGPRPVRVARPEFPAAEDTQERTYEDDERGAPGFRMDRDPSSNPITLEHPVDAMSPTTPTLRPEPSPSSTTPPSREFESTTPPNDLESSAVAAPTHRRTPTSDEVRHVAPALSSDPSRPPERTPLATRSLPDSTASEPSVDDTGSSEPVEATPQAPRLGRRIRAVSHYGGLLFLLRPMARCGAWEVLADLRERHACELRPMVHTLAGLMVPSLAPDDPARLALCGLPPFAEVPALSASDRARALLIEDLTDLSERVLATLTDLMSSESALEDPKGLLSWLVRRRVEILADPGWFELRFALDTVETEIRRAGLDCDPGFIPYLGVVIRFVYVER